MAARSRRQKKNDVLIGIEIREVVAEMDGESAKNLLLYILDIGAVACEAGYLKEKDGVRQAVFGAVTKVADERMKALGNAYERMIYRSAKERVIEQTTSWYESRATQSENRTKKDKAEKATTAKPEEEQESANHNIAVWLNSKGINTDSAAMQNLIDGYIRVGGTTAQLTYQKDPVAFMKTYYNGHKNNSAYYNEPELPRW